MITLMIVTEGKIELVQTFEDFHNCCSFLLDYQPDYEKNNCYMEDCTGSTKTYYVKIKNLPNYTLYLVSLESILKELGE